MIPPLTYRQMVAVEMAMFQGFDALLRSFDHALEDLNNPGRLARLARIANDLWQLDGAVRVMRDTVLVVL